ncbi:MAG: PVC-type heme-binding CxxCH protein [Pirellulales bacterium]
MALCGAARAAEDPFAAGVRPTEPLTPDEERKALVVPPGFEVQLVAAEPDIFKPLNLAFDERGRLWVTDTLEYPYPAPRDRPGRDSIKILEDFGEDGAARKVTTFADGLNIPIGIYPHGDTAIAWSIPNIWRFEDTNGDGRADKRQPLYGPFDTTRDTHGMNNSFRRDFDGWLYACHGFNNHSKVRGRDGNEVEMQSGNTYRVRLDGSRIEHFTHGQVNPFGMATDELGNLFTADCHSKPVYQLLRGGFYPSFGKPDDGLGFVPPMMEHLHGSTAIAGVAVYADTRFPAEFRGDLFSGNVMTSRVNRNRREFHGSTILAREQPDFVVSKDPWFRPVDIALGPDGALYIADFYNRIIGHYEVPLNHPGRDRYRGRIWRIVYRGEKGDAATHAPPNLTRSSPAELVTLLESENLSLRLLVTNYLVDRIGAAAIEPARAALAATQSPSARSHLLWVLHRLSALDAAALTKAASDADREVRVHAMKILADMPKWDDAQGRLALAGLRDADAFVRRAAADALGLHRNAEDVPALLAALKQTPAEDNHLVHTIRMALRDHFLEAGVLAKFGESKLDEETSRTVAAIAVAAPTSNAADFLVAHLQRHAEPPDTLRRYVEHAARYVSAEKLADLANVVRRRFANDLTLQTALLSAIRGGLAQRGISDVSPLRGWAEELADRLLDASNDDALSWTNEPPPDKPNAADPWSVQVRASADGDDRGEFFCSLPKGEQGIGTLRSQPFDAPAELSLFVAGHDGPPGMPLAGKNVVRLRDVEKNGVLMETTPPRNDLAQRVQWNLSAHVGRRVCIEIVDGDAGGAYAWLGVGRFSLAALNPSEARARLRSAAELAGLMKLAPLAPKLKERLASPSLDAASCTAVAAALVAIEPDARAAALATVVSEANAPAALVAACKTAINERGDEKLGAALAEAMTTLPERLQLAMAEHLAATATGAEALLALAEAGKASPRLLQRPSVRQRLESIDREAIRARAAKLTEGLPSENELLAKLITARRAGFDTADKSADRGQAVFAKHCAACHQVAGKGATVGPQLDGIGGRGLERVLEDVLDPNRNVDVAFRTTTLRLTDGQIVAGLVRREEGETLVLANEKGEEVRINKDEIDEEAKGQLSLMPANVHEIVAEADFYDLLAYLLAQRAKSP